MNMPGYGHCLYGFVMKRISGILVGSITLLLMGCGESSTTTESNHPPTIEGSPDTSIVVNENYRFIPTAQDEDGDNLSFSIFNKPTWCSFDTTTGQLSGNPGSSDIGNYPGIVISVSDGIADTSLPAFNLNVSEQPDSGANHPPIISGSPVTQIVVHESYLFTPIASVADGDTLYF